MVCKDGNLANPRICVVSTCLGEDSGGYYRHIISFLHILQSLTHDVVFINCGQGGVPVENMDFTTVEIGYKKRYSVCLKMVSYLGMQLRLCRTLVTIRRNVDKNIFFLSGTLLLPTLTARLFRKTAILTSPGAESQKMKMGNQELSFVKHLLPRAVSLLEILTCMISSRIIVDTPHVTSTLGLRKYENKISYGGGEKFVDLRLFHPTSKISNRKSAIGYLGRLSEEKGIREFVEALPLVVRTIHESEFVVLGEGQLRETILRQLDQQDIAQKVKLVGWVAHDYIPQYLNELRLLVLPSHTEALPNVLLEAMACGTPVLATPVGAIPDVIKDGETGFIMENVSPECIAENIIRALNHPNLEQIARNARALVEREFTFEKAVERYRDILMSLR